MTIVVIEDDAIVADTLALYLGQAGFEVKSAGDGVTGLALAERPDTSLVILDLMIPGLPGFDVCRKLRAVSSVPVLMLTARVSERDRIAGLDLGADDYVGKPFSPREVVARVQALLRRIGRAPDPPPPIVIGDLAIDSWARQARVKGAPIALTPTEFKILETLARARGRVFSREELLARTFGPGYDGLDRTIDAHITNLRRKIEPGKEPRYILTSHGTGYRLVGPGDD
jgi:DNA-binding response OmpR family regulator